MEWPTLQFIEVSTCSTSLWATVGTKGVGLILHAHLRRVLAFGLEQHVPDADNVPKDSDYQTFPHTVLDRRKTVFKLQALPQNVEYESYSQQNQPKFFRNAD